MKNYLNLFYDMIDKIHDWESQSSTNRQEILSNFLNNSADILYLVNYFEKYRVNLSNKTLNFHIKGVIKR
jgi:cytochrome b pre-mRNA-processing protein 3